MQHALPGVLLEHDAERTFRERADAFEESDQVFLNKYRLTKELVRWLCHQLRPALQPRRATRRTLTVAEQILIALRFYATGSFQGMVATDRDLSVSQSTVSRVLFRVTNAIVLRLAPLWIKFPLSSAEVHAAMAGFQRKWKLPGVIGCIDGTLVCVTAPSESSGQYQKSAFFCRKQYFALNAMVVCDSSMTITSLDCSFSGGTHDAYVWRHSELREELRSTHSSNVRKYLLGDSGYPLEPWLLTPLPGEQEPSTPEARYGSRHRRARSTVERCIGLLKARFRCLQRYRGLHYSPHRASNIVVACAVLHNICMHWRAPPADAQGEDDLEDGEASEDSTSHPVPPRETDTYEAGAAVRAQLIDDLRRAWCCFAGVFPCYSIGHHRNSLSASPTAKETGRIFLKLSVAYPGETVDIKAVVGIRTRDTSRGLGAEA
ncbi:putative nuclease HARBI1 [Ornithodoros turicata]|uniref:putative nuclease HARBI1 n=1 Tax=Ornithodoros turicata TaxID=34597 RepID=UPI003139E3D4